MSSVPVSVIGKTDDLRIRGVRALIAPQLLSEQLPVDAEALATVGNARRAIHRVLHGADDPYVPEADIAAFQKELRDAKVDWQMVYYSGAVHAFSPASMLRVPAIWDGWFAMMPTVRPSTRPNPITMFGAKSGCTSRKSPESTRCAITWWMSYGWFAESGTIVFRNRSASVVSNSNVFS